MESKIKRFSGWISGPTDGHVQMNIYFFFFFSIGTSYNDSACNHLVVTMSTFQLWANWETQSSLTNGLNGRVKIRVETLVPLIQVSVWDNIPNPPVIRMKPPFIHLFPWLSCILIGPQKIIDFKLEYSSKYIPISNMLKRPHV